MAKRFQVGDIYAVRPDEKTTRYFQHVATDATQLGSDVIRAFKASVSTETPPDWNKLVRSRVDFFAHVFLKLGRSLGVWERVGEATDLGPLNILFRDTDDYGNDVQVSDDWWVWRINQEARRVGKLVGENRKAEIGIVVTPHHIVDRMKTGDFQFVYPKFG